MQEIIIMKKIIHWFINDMVVKRDTKIIAIFSPLVYQKVPSKIRKIVGIVQTSGKKYQKPYLLFNFEIPDVNSLKLSTWVINVQSAINNAYQLALEDWDTNQKQFYSKKRMVMSLVLLARLMEICRLSISLSKTLKLAGRNIR